MQTQKRTVSKTKLIKRPLFWVVTVLVVLALVALAIILLGRGQSKNSIEQRPPNTVDYGPPSEEEKKETEAFKEEQQKGTPQPTPPPSNGKQSVTPTISYVGQYDAAIEASAFVSTIFEDGGICTLTLTHNGQSVTKTSPASKDAKTTRCELFAFDAKELRQKGAGTWTATVSYESATAKGTSQPSEFEVK